MGRGRGLRLSRQTSMVRFLPRLTRIIQAQDSSQIFPFDIKKYRPRRPKSLHKPTSPNPSFDLVAYPQSVLLDKENPIATPDSYVWHKTLPPRVFVPQNAQQREGEHDRPRQMIDEERRWWSSPYLRMLATPPRHCALSGHLLPSALLLRLATLRIDNTEPTTNNRPVPCIIAPDGLQHPQFTARRSNRSAHVACSRQAISFCVEQNRIGTLPGYARIPPNLTDQVSHLLRVRVLQELDLLFARLKAKPKADILANPPIRRLSKAEWVDVQENRRIPWQDAVAVVNVPPISKWIEPSMSPFPLPLDPEMKANAAHPVALFHPVSRDSTLPSNFQYRDVLPSAKVPLYDSLSLFPHAAQRAAFYQLLGQAQSRLDAAQGKQDSSSDSDAYLLSSNSEIIQLVDMPAVAIAMWRVYLYERNIVRE